MKISTQDHEYRTIEEQRLQNTSGKHSNDIDLSFRLHLQTPHHNGRNGNQPDVKYSVDGRVGACSIPNIIIGAITRQVDVKHATERPGHEEGCKEVREHEQGVEYLRADQDESKSWTFKDSLVEEDDGHLGHAEGDCVELGTGKVELQEWWEFPKV